MSVLAEGEICYADGSYYSSGVSQAAKPDVPRRVKAAPASVKQKLTDLLSSGQKPEKRPFSGQARRSQADEAFAAPMRDRYFRQDIANLKLATPLASRPPITLPVKPSPPQNAPTLVGLTPGQMSLLTPEAFREAFAATPTRALRPAQLMLIDGDETFRRIAHEVLDHKAAPVPISGPPIEAPERPTLPMPTLPRPPVLPPLPEPFEAPSSPPLPTPGQASIRRISPPIAASFQTPRASSEETALLQTVSAPVPAPPARVSTANSVVAQPPQDVPSASSAAPIRARVSPPQAAAQVASPAPAPAPVPSRATTLASNASADPSAAQNTFGPALATLRLKAKAVSAPAPVASTPAVAAACAPATTPALAAVTLMGMTSEQMRTLSPEKFRVLFKATPLRALTPQQLAFIDSEKIFCEIAHDVLNQMDGNQGVMRIRLAKQLEAFVARQIEAGFYRDASELISESLRLLQKQTDLHLLRLSLEHETEAHLFERLRRANNLGTGKS